MTLGSLHVKSRKVVGILSGDIKRYSRTSFTRDLDTALIQHLLELIKLVSLM